MPLIDRGNYLLKIDLATILIFCVCFCVLPVKLDAQENEFESQALMIVKTAEKYHFNPRPVDNEFSEYVFDHVIEKLDPLCIHFTHNTISELNSFRQSIDEEILSGKNRFIDSLTFYYEKSLIQSDSIIKELEYAPLFYTSLDTLDIETASWPVNREIKFQKWKSLVKYQILGSNYYNDTTGVGCLELNSEKELKKQTLSMELCKVNQRFSESHGGLQGYVKKKYLNAIARAFDPHTAYLSDAEEKVFTDLLSRDINSYGIECFINESGEVEIAKVIPGSSAWLSNQINEGDIIKSIIDGEHIIELTCISLIDFLEVIADQNVNSLLFVITKQNGSTERVTLEKTRVNVQENLIQSYVLESDNKVGYIYLPSFYEGFDHAGNITNGCSNDIAKELLRLRQEGIEGLIIDLRDNGGGSMHEAILMSGMFIDYGALGITIGKDVNAYTLKDMNRGVLFDKPLVILVNQFSASASEFFAASMQDQNRAVIVGANTFGKSTYQQIVPVNLYKAENEMEYNGTPPAYLKLTRGAFYRVTGETHQNKGVIPDVLLPTIYDGLTINEGTYASALNLCRINKKTYYYPQTPLPIFDLRDAVKKRVNTDSAFLEIKRISEDLQSMVNKKVPLERCSFYEYMKRKESIYSFQKPHDEFRVINTTFKDDLSRLSAIEQQQNYYNKNKIERDVYIKEAFYVTTLLLNPN